ncbi:MAG: beta-lactamase family protein, partial [Rhodospirillaceae bacterium]|nr:beta-lactamase family protein [Rhodospirillaceae bacterium]
MTDADLSAAVAHAFRPVADAVAARRLPGAVFGVVSASGARAVEAAGHAAWLPEERPLDRATWFDLASMTKVLVTVREVLRLVEDGVADLHDPVSALLPDIAQVPGTSPIRNLTLAALATHTAGLPAWAPIYANAADPAGAAAAVLQTDWPLGAPCYSDIGYMMLGLAVERARGARLAELVDQPGLAAAPPAGAEVAATEDCQWRGRVLVGEVHDENSAGLGGFAGHAGLFGTMDGVLDAAAAILAGTWLGPAAMAGMSARHTPTRAFGWQIRHAVPAG